MILVHQSMLSHRLIFLKAIIFENYLETKHLTNTKVVHLLFFKIFSILQHNTHIDIYLFLSSPN